MAGNSGLVQQLMQQVGEQPPLGVSQPAPAQQPAAVMDTGIQATQAPAAPTQVSTAINPAAPQPLGGK